MQFVFSRRIPSLARVSPLSTAFKTDTDISQKATPRRDRELQAWQPESGESGSASAQGAAGATNAPRNVDELTFGAGATGGSWDQFAVNEKLFGVKAGFDEDAYTTKLDRNAPDFKEKERKAQQLANEIMNVSGTSLDFGYMPLTSMAGDVLLLVCIKYVDVCYGNSRLPTMFTSPKSVS